MDSHATATSGSSPSEQALPRTAGAEAKTGRRPAIGAPALILSAISLAVMLVDSRGARLPAAITELRPLGEFATWRATRAVGDHDSNTFLLRADPLASTSAVQPGMSVWIVPGTVTTTNEGGAPHDQASP